MEDNWVDEVEAELVLVPEGEYVLRYIDRHIRRMHGSEKLYMRFEIIKPSSYEGHFLTRYFNIRTRASKDRPRIHAGWMSDLMREYVAIEGKKPRRTDEIRFKAFSERPILALVETVTHDSKKRLIPEPLQYSRISQLIRYADELA